MVTELLRENIIKPANFQGPFCSNSHAVSKPDKKHSISGKADIYLLKQAGQATNHARLTLDLRSLNKHALGKPKINLPSYRDLAVKFIDHFVTNFDLCSHYWAINIKYK